MENNMDKIGNNGGMGAIKEVYRDDSVEHSRRELLRLKLRESEKKLSNAVQSVSSYDGNYSSENTNAKENGARFDTKSKIGANGNSSYQHTPAPIPHIHHYDEDEHSSSVSRNRSDPNRKPNMWQRFQHARADASLRPNTGQTNSYDYALFGLAMHELLELLRWANIVAALSSMGLLLSTFLERTLTLRISQLVLCGYLALLSFFLFLNELIQLPLWNISSMERLVADNFGILHRPSGKVFYLYFLSSLCFAIGGFAELLVGVTYFMSATLLLACYCWYAELRETEANDVESLAGSNGGHTWNGSILYPSRQGQQQQQQSWSYFSSSGSNGVFARREEATETDVLLHT